MRHKVEDVMTVNNKVSVVKQNLYLERRYVYLTDYVIYIYNKKNI